MQGEWPLLLEPHNNCALQPELRMWTMPETGIHLFFGTAHPQKGVPQFASRKAAGVLDGKPSSGRGDSSRRGSSKATPKKDSKVAPTNSQDSSTPLASQPSPHCSGWGTSHHHKSQKKDSGERRKKVDDASPAQRGTGHKACKDRGHR